MMTQYRRMAKVVELGRKLQMMKTTRRLRLRSWRRGRKAEVPQWP